MARVLGEDREEFKELVGRKSRRAQGRSYYSKSIAPDLSRSVVSPIALSAPKRCVRSDHYQRRPNKTAQIRRGIPLTNSGNPGRAEIFALPTYSGFNLHTRTQNLNPKNNENRSLTCSPPSALFTTANIVDPDPDIKATSVSACCSNQLFISGNSRYFWKTGSSKSLRKGPHSVFLVCARFCSAGNALKAE